MTAYRRRGILTTGCVVAAIAGAAFMMRAEGDGAEPWSFIVALVGLLVLPMVMPRAVARQRRTAQPADALGADCRAFAECEDVAGKPAKRMRKKGKK
jgi:hypothetical protein